MIFLSFDTSAFAAFLLWRAFTTSPHDGYLVANAGLGVLTTTDAVASTPRTATIAAVRRMRSRALSRVTIPVLAVVPMRSPNRVVAEVESHQ